MYDGADSVSTASSAADCTGTDRVVGSGSPGTGATELSWSTGTPSSAVEIVIPGGAASTSATTCAASTSRTSPSGGAPGERHGMHDDRPAAPKHQKEPKHQKSTVMYVPT